MFWAARNTKESLLCACCRVDKDRRRYTGALCGLGCSTDDRLPLLPDHDMEVAFDVDIDDEDIHLVGSSSVFSLVQLGPLSVSVG